MKSPYFFAGGRTGRFFTLCLAIFVSAAAPLTSGEPDGNSSTRNVLSIQEWKRLDEAIDRGIAFLQTTQDSSDGAFAAPKTGQPGITSLCVMAHLARGHVPDDGPYHESLRRAIEYALDSQRESGILFELPYGQVWQRGTPSHTGIYNHAITGLMLSEVYGMTQYQQSDRIGEAIIRAVEFTREQQRRPKRNPVDDGGWRYLGKNRGLRSDADLSITSWQLMFLRSARNNGFDIPREPIDDALGYVKRSFDEGRGAFTYGRISPGDYSNRAIVGSGILSLALGGEHHTNAAKTAGLWVLEHPFDRYNQVGHHEERYHYSAYYCSQAMFQLGGDYWKQFYPGFMKVLLENQREDGSWPPESNRDSEFGNAYTTALVILALSPPYQLLPIYQ
ncbi:MAG: prenyltransferase/squalene oxidase repeat-containing protein [Planctomyces sp.]